MPFVQNLVMGQQRYGVSKFGEYVRYPRSCIDYARLDGWV